MTRARAAVLALSLLAYPAASCATPPRTPADETTPPTQSRAAQAQNDVRARAEALLDRGAPAQDWKALGADGLRALEQISNDPAAPPERRARAIQAMGVLELPEATGKLAAILKDAHAEPRYRAQAATAIARLSGDDVGPALDAALADPNAQVRLAVARALAGVGGETARGAIEKRLSEEEDAAVREALEQSLTKQQP